MTIEKIIILEGDPVHRGNLENYFRRLHYDVASASNIEAAREFFAKDSFDIIFMELRLPDGDGREFLNEIMARPQKPLVVITTGSESVESAVGCIKDGAFDYLIKPFSEQEAGIILRKAGEFTQLVRVNRLLSHQADEEEHVLLGNSADMDSLRQLIHKVARTQATVLIQGESGTGKEAVARALYRESSRSRAPFIRVNCAAIPENLIESEFFGHEKGAFTGAMTKREGRFELAHGGTILLDEISEISPQVQAKLLRVLQEREFERVGGNRTIKVDVRVIATTNRDLKESVQKKEFRQDLFFRLNVVPIHVTPLRNRRQDILVLKKEFMRRFSRRHGIRVKGFSDEARKVLLNYQWPGNVRELQNVVERAVILCNDNEMLEPKHLGLGGSSQASDAARDIIDSLGEHDGFPTLAEVERKHILSVLDHCQNNRTHAARLLKVSIRTLRNKLNDFPDVPPAFVQDKMAAQA